MNIFDFRQQLIDDYAGYTRSFIQIRDDRLRDFVQSQLDAGTLWPEPLIQLNPSFEPGALIDELTRDGVLHPECSRVFRLKPDATSSGQPLRLHRHQTDAIRIAREGHPYVLTTGTGSGKSMAYIVPIVDFVVRRGSGRGIKAIVVYPMNALANSQLGELRKFLCHGYPDGRGPVTFERYTGQESEADRERILAQPPDILLTNYVMLELILTRPKEQPLIEAAQGLQFLVLDELHTYRGRQGADVSLLVRRVRDFLNAPRLQCVGTSATLAGVGSFAEQQRQVADVATQLFGVTVRPGHVIGETLRRTTPARDTRDSGFVVGLKHRINDPGAPGPPSEYREFVNDPLSSWIESTFGVQLDSEGTRLIRVTPRRIGGEDGAAANLSRLTGIEAERCAEAIREALQAGYSCEREPQTNRPPFAFRLHQFIGRGDTVYASVENETDRHATLTYQQFVPNSDRKKVLLPLVFCRECGQEYYCVRRVLESKTGKVSYTPRELNDRANAEDSFAGYLHFSQDKPWPSDRFDQLVELLPDDWVEEHRGQTRIKPSREDDLPQPVRVSLLGEQTPNGLNGHFLPAPFRFCLNCGVAYNARQSSDFGKLTALGSEGRSTATTILSLSTIRHLRTSDLSPQAHKLLCFTDNRQDASLQAGHFNDFIEVGLMRGALFAAVQAAGPIGIGHDELTQRVFEQLGLPIETYSSNPTARFKTLTDAQRALRNVLGFRLYRDLKRGWRVTSPNLEQCGLLEIRYESLEDVCAAPDVWQHSHPALVAASAETRQKIAKVLLDYLRRELVIKVDYLNPAYQESLLQQSSQHLIDPWAIDENESQKMEHAAILFPRSSQGRNDYGGNLYLTGRGGFGQYLGRPRTFPEQPQQRLTLDDRQAIILDLLRALQIGGLLEVVAAARGNEDVPGYQLSASVLRWVAGDGTRAFHDPIRVPQLPPTGGRTNPFFVHFYRNIAKSLHSLEAREHTAQVPYERRLDREERFRAGSLPVLYCSPTMELGIDISDLNVVNLRNIPPTPANYAQRSGRAGRSGQPALVVSYCSTGSSHDQYFFRRPERMVAGSVTPSRLDVANEDLIRAHIYAIWLAESGLSLGKSLKDLLDLAGDTPTLDLQSHVRAAVNDTNAGNRTRDRAKRVLATVGDELAQSGWYSDGWLDEVLAQVGRQFDRACERWRGLYRAALVQANTQTRIILDASRPLADKQQAERLRREAEAQLKLLTETEEFAQSDFYSYRYFASEGFLPGYNFPRLPLSAFIPARRTKQREEYLSRPRFLAISEFGPRSVVYHEGSRYQINRVILPVRDDELLTTQAKQCDQCGYLHPMPVDPGPDLCQRCGAKLPPPLRPLLRMQNVATKRRDRINCDEEERLRLGYEIRTGVRLAEHGGIPVQSTATVMAGDQLLATLTYGRAATIWRINVGERRRSEPTQLGFVLDTERGYWQSSKQLEEDPDDPMSASTRRVIPFVEDRRNCLLLEPNQELDLTQFVSLEAAIKNAIHVAYQLEDNELATEILPNSDTPRMLLLYESTEGGAGVLRRLLDDPADFAHVAERALDLCHYDPKTGADRRRAERATEDCEAACYDCLMHYGNQPVHRKLDRSSIRDLLIQFAQATTLSAPSGNTRPDHLTQLKRLAGSDLERSWLDFIDAHDLRLPSHAQHLIEACHTRPDFFYSDYQAAIYVDGPHHDFPERATRDATLTEAMEDQGFTVIRFHHQDDWQAIVARFPHVFGRSP